jgi:hypothetical protein
MKEMSREEKNGYVVFHEISANQLGNRGVVMKVGRCYFVRPHFFIQHA